MTQTQTMSPIRFASLAFGSIFLGASVVAACGGSVEPGASVPTTAPASSSTAPAPSDDSAPLPDLTPTACATAGIIADFDAPIADIAVDDDDVWVVLARASTWSLWRAPKCGGAPVQVGDAPKHAELRAPAPLRVAVAPRGGAVVEWWDRSPILALTGFGAAAKVDQITLGSNFVPLALAIGADAVFTSRGVSLDVVPLNDGQLTKMPLQIVPTGESRDDHIHDLWLDGSTLYATTNTRVHAVDVATQSALSSPTVLASQGPRFVRSRRDHVFLVDNDVVRLPKDLSSWDVVPTGAPGPVLDVAINDRGLFYAKRQDDGREIVSRLPLDGHHPETVSARAGIDTQLAVDTDALFVARDSHVERIALTAP